MKTTQVNTQDPLVQRLHDVVASYPGLRVAARLYETILPLVRDTDIRIAPLPLDPAKICAGLEKGVPALSCFEMEADFQELEGLLLRLIRAIETLDTTENREHSWKFWCRNPDLKDADGQTGLRSLPAAALNIRTAYEDGRLDLGEILSFAAGGNYDEIAELAGKLQLCPDLLQTLAQNALKPVLQSCRREMAPLTAGLQWDNKGYCFVCGSWATLGELQDNGQAKHLRCGQCGADWQFSRLQCLCCGNEDHKTQRCLYPENRQPVMWIEVCDRCGSYLKIISTFSPALPEMLPVEDLATLHLDYIAREHGYTRATSTGEGMP